jgi:chitodextrinase
MNPAIHGQSPVPFLHLKAVAMVDRIRADWASARTHTTDVCQASGWTDADCTDTIWLFNIAIENGHL